MIISSDSPLTLTPFHQGDDGVLNYQGSRWDAYSFFTTHMWLPSCEQDREAIRRIDQIVRPQEEVQEITFEIAGRIYRARLLAVTNGFEGTLGMRRYSSGDYVIAAIEAEESAGEFVPAVLVEMPVITEGQEHVRGKLRTGNLLPKTTANCAGELMTAHLEGERLYEIFLERLEQGAISVDCSPEEAFRDFFPVFAWDQGREGVTILPLKGEGLSDD